MITNDQFGDFLHDVFSDDPVRSADFRSGFEIIELELKNKIINATYQFIYSDTEANDWSLFEMTEDYNNESFPKGIILCTINEDFIWGSNDSLNVLDKDDFYYDNANPSFDTFLWGDLNLSEDWIDCFFDRYDKYMVGESLVTIHGASKDKVPEFIPDRIKLRIKECIDEYLNDN